MPQTLGLHLELVANGLDPDDDLPKDDWATCFCRDTPKEVMVTCEECKGAYHPKCVKVAPKQADKPFVCEMCSDQYETDRPSVNALATFIDRRKWDFVIPPAEVLTIEAILHAFVRYAKLVLDLADPKDMVEKCQDHHLIAHHLRKMYNIPLLFDARHTDTNTVIVFETWLKRRWREARDYATSKPKSAAAPVPPHTSRRNGDQKYTRSRKPKFVLKESREGEFSCICSTPPIDALLVVYCLRCQQGYHASCVHCSLDQVADVGKWKCPCCAVKSGQHFQRNVELRIQMTGKLNNVTIIVYWR
jgi:histone demethylase JARID1